VSTIIFTGTRSSRSNDSIYRWVGRVLTIGRQGLDYPFTEIAKQVGVDEKTIRAIFAEYVKELEKDFKRETPVILGLDEIYLSTPRCAFRGT